MNPDFWLPAAPRPGASRRLVILPHAGSGTAAWFRWAAGLPADVEVRVARLPGRENRLAEPAPASAAEAVDALARALRSLPGMPLVVLGHSLGAALAHGLCAAVPGAARALVLSGETAPGTPRGHDELLGLGDRELARTADRLWGGVPPEILDHPDALALFLPALRGDLALAASVRAPTGPPLDIPFDVFVGADDPLDEDGWRGWAAHTRGATTFHRHPGGHMAVLDVPAVADRITRTCLGRLS
ncbi:thioesterase II family protein [Kitasatospora sp. NPDC058170]|uniref:thioesterase II family protein n=1 Tax=Kitasatospora sp. NPDC058170 TaxID=3346364 RepID=UPI0036DE360B